MSNDLEWTGGDHIASYNVAPGLCPWMIMLRNHKVEFIGKTWAIERPARLRRRENLGSMRV